MKRIALNALGLKSYTGGVESYIFNTINSLVNIDKENLYYLFIGKNVSNVFEPLKEIKNLKIIVYPINTHDSTLRVIWESSVLAFDLIRYRINLVHHTCNYVPWVCPVKSIVTIHDLSVFFYNEKYPQYRKTIKFFNYFQKAVKFSIKKAEKVIAISAFTKNELLKYFNIKEEKILIVEQSIDERKRKGNLDKSIFKKYGIAQPYFLSVSIVRPHKNYDFLIRVFNKIKQEYNIPHMLVIIGGIYFGEETFLNELEKSPYKDSIKYLGFVDNDDMSTLYTFADAFIFPSLYEGFGIPILEAMEYMIPVICSNTASLPEVGGDAVELFNPYNEEETCERLYNLITDKSLREKNIKNARRRLEFYSRKNMTSKLIEIYKEII